MTTIIKWPDGRMRTYATMPTFSINPSWTLPMRWQLSARVARQYVRLMISDNPGEVQVRLTELMVACELARESGEVMELEAMG